MEARSWSRGWTLGECGDGVVLADGVGMGEEGSGIGWRCDGAGAGLEEERGGEEDAEDGRGEGGGHCVVELVSSVVFSAACSSANLSFKRCEIVSERGSRRG